MHMHTKQNCQSDQVQMEFENCAKTVNHFNSCWVLTRKQGRFQLLLFYSLLVGCGILQVLVVVVQDVYDKTSTSIW